MIKTIYPVTHSTKYVGPGTTFVAIKGRRFNGVDFIQEAVKKGATQIVVERTNSVPEDTLRLLKSLSIEITWVDNIRRSFAELSAQALGYPAKKLNIIGITGTKGKTTTSFLLEHILSTAGHSTALLTTVYNKIDQMVIPSELTTAHPDFLHMFFDECIRKNIRYVVMEVAAQALTLDRVFGIEFKGALFTNFSQEHGEFYTTLNDYFQAKSLLFNQCITTAPRIINGDDEWCKRLLEGNDSYKTFGTDTADYDIHSVVECRALPGLFNMYNVVAAWAMAAELGVEYNSMIQACSTFKGVPGRMQKYTLSNGAVCYIDYAHNPSSFEAVFSTLRGLTDNLIVVFGCGGNKDKAKRPVMGSIAAEYADHIVLTSDDPRDEDPHVIIEDIMFGISNNSYSKVTIEVDRKQAIEKAYGCSHAGSIIALLGKGPAEYQEVKGIKYPFSERTIIQEFR